MKNFKNIMLFVMIGSLLTFTTSCKSDDDGGGGGAGAAAGTVVAKIDGADFSSMQLASYATTSTGGGSTTLIITGGNSTGSTIILTITGYDGVGTYNISSDDVIFNSAVFTEVDISDISNPVTTSWLAPYMDSGVAGSVSVSSDDGTTFVGTFEFEAQAQNGNSTKNFTNGAFNVDLLN